MLNRVKQFYNDELGQSTVEYTLLLVLIGAVAVILLTGMGTSITSIFNKIANMLNTADNSISTSTPSQ